MQTSRILVALLLLATVLVDLVFLSMAVRLGPDGLLNWPDDILAILFSIAFSQVSIAAAWAGLSHKALPWKLTGPVAVLTFWSLALGSVLKDHPMGYDRHDWTILFLAQVLPTLSIVLVIRAKGGRLLDPRTAETDPQKRRWQFSLLHLLTWLTVTAVALGLLRCTIDYDSIAKHCHLWLEAAWIEVWFVALSNSAICLATLWATLCRSSLIWRLTVLSIVLAAAFSPLLTFGVGLTEILPFALLWPPQVLWVWAWLKILQTIGITFTWQD